MKHPSCSGNHWILRAAAVVLPALLVAAALTLLGWERQWAKLRTLKGHRDTVVFVAFSPDGGKLVSESWDNTMRFWDVKTGETSKTLTVPEPLPQAGQGALLPIGRVALSPDGSRLAIADRVNRINVVDMGTGAREWTQWAHSDNILSLSFSPDGKTVASGGNDRKVSLHDARTGSLSRWLRPHQILVGAVAFPPDGKMVVSSDYSFLKLWDAATGKLRRQMASPRVDWIAWSADGTRMAAGSEQNAVHLWDVKTWRRTRTLTERSVQSVAFSPDGRTLATGSGKAIRLWHADTGRLKRTLTAYDRPRFYDWLARLFPGLWGRRPGPVRSLAFSPDGGTLAAANGNDVQLWRVP